LSGDFRRDRGDYARVLILFCTRGFGRPAFPAPLIFRRQEVQAKLARTGGEIAKSYLQTNWLFEIQIVNSVGWAKARLRRAHDVSAD
jgi:hypothetical protein